MPAPREQGPGETAPADKMDVPALHGQFDGLVLDVGLNPSSKASVMIIRDFFIGSPVRRSRVFTRWDAGKGHADGKRGDAGAQRAAH